MAYNKTSNNKQLTHEIVSLIFSDATKSFLVAIAASERSKHFALVAFIDLDHFKAINYIKGHDAATIYLKPSPTA